MSISLLDAVEYPITKLLRLYGLRWEVELDLRHLKTTLSMEHLRGKTPQMVHKELYAHLLAYNLLRTLMWESGITHAVNPSRLSLQRTRQHLQNFIPELASASPKKLHRLYRTLLEAIAHKLVPRRIGRSEPRVRKRRPKAYPLMQQPRQLLRQKCYGV